MNNELTQRRAVLLWLWSHNGHTVQHGV